MTSYLQQHTNNFVISGTGRCVGARQLTNEQLMELSGSRLRLSFIDRSIGIKTRYFLAPEQTTSDLAAAAASQALKDANVTIDQVDRLIVGTSTPDHQTPSTACIVQYKLGGKGFPASDIVAACSGFMYALDQGLRCLATGDETVLVVGVDCRSRTLNMQDKRTLFLYGDGAGAVVLQRRAGGGGGKQGFFDCFLTADGEGHDAVFVPAGGAKEPCTVENVREQRHRLFMPDGKRVANNALFGFVHLINTILDRNKLTLDDIDQVIFHQPNFRLLEIVMKELGIDESKAYINFREYGNTVAGSVPIALSEAISKGRIKSGDTVLLCAVGGGFTGGAALFTY